MSRNYHNHSKAFHTVLSPLMVAITGNFFVNQAHDQEAQTGDKGDCSLCGEQFDGNTSVEKTLRHYFHRTGHLVGQYALHKQNIADARGTASLNFGRHDPANASVVQNSGYAVRRVPLNREAKAG